MAWFGNIIKVRRKLYFFSQNNIVEFFFFTIETIQIDLMFRIHEENTNPGFYRELYTHSPIK